MNETERPSARQAVAFFDLDGTLTTGHMWAGLRSWNRRRRRRRGRETWFLLTHVPLAIRSKTGRISAESSGRRWMDGLASLLRGISIDELKAIVRHTWQMAYAPGLRAAIVQTLRRHQRQGLPAVLVSGTFQAFLKPFREELGLNHLIGTGLEIVDGVLTGRVDGAVVTGPEKVRRVNELIQRNGLDVDLSASFAYADNERDLDLLRLVGNPVAVCPSAKLERIARASGWPVLGEAM